MTAMPVTEEVRGQLDYLSDESQEEPRFYTEVAIGCETSRRRAVGEVALFLVDSPWSFLGMFTRAVAGRGGEMRTITITSDGAVVRPIPNPAQLAAELWINSVHEDPDALGTGFAEYITAESQVPGEEEPGGGADAAGFHFRAGASSRASGSAGARGFCSGSARSLNCRSSSPWNPSRSSTTVPRGRGRPSHCPGVGQASVCGRLTSGPHGSARARSSDCRGSGRGQHPFRARGRRGRGLNSGPSAGCTPTAPTGADAASGKAQPGQKPGPHLCNAGGGRRTTPPWEDGGALLATSS